MKYIDLSDALAGTAAIVDFGRLIETRRRRERSLLTNLVNSPRPLSAPPSNEETSIFSCQLLTSQVFWPNHTSQAGTPPLAAPSLSSDSRGVDARLNMRKDVWLLVSGLSLRVPCVCVKSEKRDTQVRFPSLRNVTSASRPTALNVLSARIFKLKTNCPDRHPL